MRRWICRRQFGVFGLVACRNRSLDLAQVTADATTTVAGQIVSGVSTWKVQELPESRGE